MCCKANDDALAKECLDTAIKAWKTRRLTQRRIPRAAAQAGHPRQVLPEAACLPLLRVWYLVAITNEVARPPRQVPARPAHNQLLQPAPAVAAPASDWTGMRLGLTIATHGAEPYKSRLKELFPQMITPQQMGMRGWTSVRALPFLDASAKIKCRKR